MVPFGFSAAVAVWLVLFVGSDCHHRGFSSAVDYRGHDMDHSSAREKQVNSAVNPAKRWEGDQRGPAEQSLAMLRSDM